MANPDDMSVPVADGSTLIKHRPRWSASLIWLVPLVAVLLGLSVAIRAWTSQGPRIEIVFNTADGLEAGKTQVRFKNVVIGSVGSIRLSADRTTVVANVRLAKSASAFATDGSRFWVVRPRIGSSGISGIDTLLSGAFIAADAGTSQVSQDSFIGLENPPAVTQGEAGRQFLLHADDLGSLNIGSVIYYRRIQVGRVVAIKLGDNGQEIALTVFVSAPYDKLVTRSTRFWNASGLDVSLGANGLKVKTQSLATVIEGGVAFQTPDLVADARPAPADTVFRLADNQVTAMAQPDGEPRAVTMRFQQSLRGLTVNAPVEFEGVEFGQVTSIDLDYDVHTKVFSTVVGATVYPERMGRAYQKMLPEIEREKQSGRNFILPELVEHGLRAQARSGNLLTGQLYIAIDILPNAAKVAFDPNSNPLQVPTVAGQFDKLQDQVASIVDKIERLPLDAIGKGLDRDLGTLDKTLKQVNGEVLPGLKSTLQGASHTLGTAEKALGSVDGLVNDDSSLRADLTDTLQQLRRSAQSIRALTDYLGRHPESLIRGRGPALADPAAAAASTPSKP